jgi:GNAT superfamily N-acetyltransferase
MVSQARIYSEEGALAANGYAAETNDTFIYDRIVTEPEHRRKGLGHALMMALRTTRQRPDNTELLVATEAGRDLYLSLGWETISPYATASITAS